MATFGPASIAAGADDYRHYDTDTWESTSIVVTVGNDGTTPNAHAGLRWDNVTIPNGATIDSAIIDFEVNNGSAGAAIKTKISAVDEDDPAAATDDASCDTDDAARTTAKVDWDFTGSNTGGTAKQTPDFASVVQEIVDRGGWASGQALLIHIADDGGVDPAIQNFASLENTSHTEPIITITYTVPNFAGFFGMRAASWILAGASGLWLPDSASDLLDLV